MILFTCIRKIAGLGGVRGRAKYLMYVSADMHTCMHVHKVRKLNTGFSCGRIIVKSGSFLTLFERQKN